MDTICGYRVIRRLSGGARSEILLAHDAQDRTVVLRLLDIDYPEENAVACIEALRTIEHDNLMPLIDFAGLDDGRMLFVHPRVGGGSLGTLLAEDGRLELGEVVTVVSSVVGAVSALHAGGWAHRGVDTSAVLLTLGGEPVLAGTGGLERLTGEGLLADVEAVRELALGLLPRQSETAQRLAALAPTPQLAEQVAAVVGGLPEPRPIRLTRRPMVLEDVPAGMEEPHFPQATARRPPAWLVALLAADGPVLELVDKAIAALRTVRRPVWVGAAGVFAALLAAAVLIPPSDSPAEAQTETVIATNGVLPAGPSGAEGVPAGAGTRTQTEPATVQPDGGEVDGVRSDDPLEAVIALLAQRQRCLAAASESCLAGVTQDGSAAQSDARAVLASLADGQTVPGPIPFDDEAPLVQRTGGSAIVTGGSVSVLIVKGDDGWRLRDVFEAP